MRLIYIILLTIFLGGSSVNIYTSAEPPYTFNPETGNTGYLIDFLSLMDDFDYNVSFGRWSDQINNAISDDNGIFAAAIQTEERSKLFLFSDPVVDMTHTFYKLKPSTFEYNEISDLKHLRVGVIKDWKYGDHDFDNNPLINKIYYQDSTLLMIGLYKGEVDVVVTDSLIANYVLFHHLNPIYSSIESAGVLASESLRFMVNINSINAEETIVKINTEIKRVKEATNIGSLLDRYRI